VPHGLDILPIIDYVAVGNRGTCYANLAPQIARYGVGTFSVVTNKDADVQRVAALPPVTGHHCRYSEYRAGILDHLLGVRIVHWDASVRVHAKQGLEELARLYPDEIILHRGPERAVRGGQCAESLLPTWY